MKVLAEGVENTQQLDFLKNHRCDFFQGYLISQALPPVDFEHFFLTRWAEQTHISF